MGKWITIIAGIAIIAYIGMTYMKIQGELANEQLRQQSNLTQAQIDYQNSLTGEWWFQISTMLGAANPLGEVTDIDIF